MLCQKCGQAEACVHRTDIIEGEKRQLLLCGGCAAEEGLAIDPALITATASHLQKLIAPLIKSAATAGLVPLEEPFTLGPCPRCGLTWSAFRRSTRFGCPHDYVHFEPYLDELFASIHGAIRHRGRVPRSFQQKLIKTQRLSELRDALKIAVTGEEFERAASLRDEIRSLESEGGAR